MLRVDLEQAVLPELPSAIREQFVIAFANRLADAARPSLAVLPALVDAARAVRPADQRPGARGDDGWR